jgi:hypothetical protein
MKRAIFRCRIRQCGHVWAFEYPEKVLGDYVRRVEGQMGVRSAAIDAGDGCPKCHDKWPKCGLVKGKLNDGVPCDSRCTNAVGWLCSCSCAGRNHGKGFMCEAVAA